MYMEGHELNGGKEDRDLGRYEEDRHPSCTNAEWDDDGLGGLGQLYCECSYY